MSRPCLGEALTALVDGALSHAERERVHAHLARCAECRAEVDVQRALKARLVRLSAAPPPPERLTAALLGLAVPGVEPAVRPGPPLAGPVRPAGRTAAFTGPAGRGADRARRRLRRTSTVGGGLLALGVGAALLLGGPAGAPASTPVDPGSDAFVADFASTTSGVPVARTAGSATSLPR